MNSASDSEISAINSSQIRAFIALELPSELKRMIAAFELTLRDPKSNCVKWVDPGSMHLTLKFLGNIDSKFVGSIMNAIEKDVLSSQPFTLKTSETGCFPNIGGIRVFWLGIEGEIEKLLSLQMKIERSMTAFNFPKENRSFTAHLTLARLKDGCTPSDRKAFAEVIRDVRFQPSYAIKVGSVSLMRSQLTSGGAIYTRLAEFVIKEH